MWRGYFHTSSLPWCWSKWLVLAMLDSSDVCHQPWPKVPISKKPSGLHCRLRSVGHPLLSHWRTRQASQNQAWPATTAYQTQSIHSSQSHKHTLQSTQPAQTRQRKQIRYLLGTFLDDLMVLRDVQSRFLHAGDVGKPLINAVCLIDCTIEEFVQKALHFPVLADIFPIRPKMGVPTGIHFVVHVLQKPSLPKGQNHLWNGPYARRAESLTVQADLTAKSKKKLLVGTLRQAKGQGIQENRPASSLHGPGCSGEEYILQLPSSTWCQNRVEDVGGRYF